MNKKNSYKKVLKKGKKQLINFIHNKKKKNGEWKTINKFLFITITYRHNSFLIFYRFGIPFFGF